MTEPFTIGEAVRLWKEKRTTIGVFNSVHTSAYRCLRGDSWNSWNSWNSEELYGYSEHSSIEIETSILAITLDISDVEWDRMMLLEKSGHALSALMIREALIDIPDNHLPLRQDATKISSVWSIVRNIYERGDTLPTHEELQTLRNIVQD